MKTFLLYTISIFFSFFNSFGQINVANKYKNGQPICEGKSNGEVKKGHWVFYKSDGTILAKGNFKNDIAKGKWNYVDYNGQTRIYKWQWSKGFKPGTTLKLENDTLYIEQNVHFSNGVFRTYINGRKTAGGQF